MDVPIAIVNKYCHIMKISFLDMKIWQCATPILTGPLDRNNFAMWEVHRNILIL